MRARVRWLPSAALCLGLLSALPVAACAQGEPDASAPGAADAPDAGATDPQEAEEEVLAVLRGLFDAMRARDSAAVRAFFHEDGRLVATGAGPQGGPGIRVIPAGAFAGSIGRATADLDERFWGSEVRIHQDLATVWSEYAFYLDGELSHCGVDAFVLVRDAGAWKIASVADTRRREGCEVPEEARPGG